MASADRLIEIFNEALARPAGDEREQFVVAACGDEPGMAEQIFSLLKVHDGAGDFLRQEPLVPTEQPGDRIGRYKLLQQIGEGGCGVVYMAEQEQPVRRKVALKIIKLGMDTRDVIARFEAERQALALMDHPNIAKVFDAGATETGRPYFVMELVRGTRITDFCDQHNLSTDERLGLFIQVCQAIQHAHQKGIIHRDIKPSNILVTLSEPGSAGCPRVIDFGIAKATGNQRLTDQTMFTAFEQFIGTPAYMSPEQAMMTNLDIDTRTDIYALGVLLYELLTGRTPFDARDLMAAGLDAMRRIIREQEPARPSTKIGTMHAAELTEVARQRHSEPAKLGGLLRGDLDWIVMKALEKDRARRYETANGLAADIRRHLENEPVLARPPGTGYRLIKMVRRNQLAFAAGTAVAVALVLGAFASTWQAVRATRAEREQSRLRQQAEANANEAVAQRAIAEVNFRKARETVDQYFTAISQTTLLEAPGLQPLRKELLEAALTYYQSFLDQAQDQPELQADLAAAHLRLSIIYVTLDRNDDAMSAMLRGLELVEPLIRKKPGDTAFALRLAGFFTTNGDLYGQTRRPSDPVSAAKTLQRAAEIWVLFVREHPAVPEFQGDLAGICLILSGLFQAIDMDRSRAYAGRSCEILEKLVRTRPATANYQEFLLAAYGERLVIHLGNPQAEEIGQVRRHAVRYFESLVRDFPTEPSVRGSLAAAYTDLGNALRGSHPAEAEKYLHQAIGVLENAFAVSASDAKIRRKLYTAYNRLSDHLKEAGLEDEAEAIAGKSIAIMERLVAEFPGMPDYRIDLFRRHLALAYWLREARPEEAEKSYRRALAVDEKLAADFPGDGRVLRNQIRVYAVAAEMLSGEGRLAESTDAFRQIIAVLERGIASSPELWPDFREQQAHNYRNLAFRHWQAGDHAAARKAFQSSSRIFRENSTGQLPGPKATALVGEADNLDQTGQLAALEGRGGEATEAYHQALSIHERIEKEGLGARVTPGWRDGRYASLAKLLKHAGTPEIALRMGAVLRVPEIELSPAGWSGLFDCHYHLAALLRKSGHFDESDQQLARMKEAGEKLKTRLGGKSQGSATSRSVSASVFQRHSKMLCELGEFADAGLFCREAIELYAALAAEQPRLFHFHQVYDATKALKRILDGAGRAEAAAAVDYREAIDLSEKANAVRRKALGSEHLEVAESLCGLSFLYREQGALPAAEATAREALAIRRKLLNPVHAEVAQALHLLAWNLHLRGNSAEAETFSREELAMWRRLQGNDDPKVAWNLFDLTAFLRAQGKPTEAEAAIRESLAIRRKTLDKDHPDVAACFKVLSELLQAQGKPAEELN